MPNDTCTTRLDCDHAQLLVVDIQERLLPLIHAGDEVARRAATMIRVARELERPVTLSEQYPQGLGATTGVVQEAAGDADKLQKTTFSFCADKACHGRVGGLLRPQVLIVGIEAHVCVQQTALDLLGMQMLPFVLADAVGSRRALDADVALHRMRAAGVIVTTTEAAIFELLRESGTALFKRILPLVK